MLTVLGGGPAGLAVGYYARRAGIDCRVFEAGEHPGGNCITFEHGGFRFDSGAHRFHDKDAEITSDVRELLGEELQLIEVPSYIYDDDRLVDFPLSSLNLLRHLGVASFAKAGTEVLSGRLLGGRQPANFEDFAVATYGRTIAGRFLLNYSRKLWGLPCDRLSPDVAGKRLNGLDLKTFLSAAVGGRRASARHMDGRFWYPRRGYGQIAEALVAACGDGAVQPRSRVTRLRHDGTRITSIEINGEREIEAGEVVCTLPLDLLLRILDPAPEPSLRELTAGMRYRNVILAAFFLDRSSVNDAGTVYFPSERFPFTRIYEPRNRSALMSPPGRTSLVTEIPCTAGDDVWKLDDASILALAREPLAAIGWLRDREIIDATVRRLPYAYPVLETGYEAKVAAIHGHLTRLENLQFSGRSGKFLYSWLHEMLRFGKDIVAELAVR